MRYVLFADESGTSPPSKCFSIGALLIPEAQLGDFLHAVTDLILRHRIPQDREIKWERVKNSHGLINFSIDVLRLILTSASCFSGFVAWKKPFHVWNKDEEKGFYMSYTMLMEHSARILNAEVKASIDHRNNSYDKNHEVVRIIANHKLKGSIGSISDVQMVDSKEEILVQVTDLLIGAVNTAHNAYLDKEFSVHLGKRIAIEKLAEILGWDNLWYDTFPNAGFNIWHFPWKEFRGIPETKVVTPNINIEYVTAAHLNRES